MHRSLRSAVFAVSFTIARVAHADAPTGEPTDSSPSSAPGSGTQTVITTTTTVAHYRSTSQILATTGGILGAVSYGGAALFAFTYTFIGFPIPGLICKGANPGKCGVDSAEMWPWIPLAGPFFSAHEYTKPHHRDIRVFKDSPGLRAALYIDGGMQIASVGLLLGALIVDDWKPRNPSQASASASELHWVITPLRDAGVTCMGVAGSFLPRAETLPPSAPHRTDNSPCQSASICPSTFSVPSVRQAIATGGLFPTQRT